MVGELDDDPGGAEPVEQRPEGFVRGGLAPTFEGLPHRPLAAAGEDPPVPVRLRREVVQVVPRPALLGAGGQVRARHGPGEPVVAVLTVREQQQVRALGVGDAVLRPGQPEGQLGAVDRRHGRVRLGHLGHPGGTVEPVVVGQRQPVQVQARRFLDQVLRSARTVEEAEGRVRVQLGVRHDGVAVVGRRRWRDVAGALPRPRGAVAAVTGVRRVRALVGERALELRPRDGWVAVAHQAPSVTSRPPRPTSGGRRAPGTTPGRPRRRAADGAVDDRPTPTSARRAATVPPTPSPTRSRRRAPRRPGTAPGLRSAPRGRPRRRCRRPP